MINLKYRTIKAFLQLSKHRAYNQKDKEALNNLENALELAYEENRTSAMTQIANKLVSIGETLIPSERMAA